MPKIEEIPDTYTSDSDSEYSSNGESESSDSDVELNENDIEQIIFKKINDNYSYGKYGSFDVIMMNKNGYMNATKLCKKVNKRFKKWKENKYSMELIKELSKISEIEKLIILIKEGTNAKIQGTYVHPDLIPHIASWASPKFAIKVSRIVNEYFIKQAIEEKEKLIKKKDDKIDKLSHEIKSQSKEIKSQSVKIDKLTKINNRILRTNIKIKDQNDNILDKLERVCIDRVIPTGYDKDVNHLILVKNNPDPEEYYEDEEIYDYSVLRIMKNNIGSKLSKHKGKYPEMKLLLNIDGSPNSVVLWKRIRNKLGKKIEVTGCNFNLLKKNYRQSNLIQDIRDMHEERLNIDTDDD